MDGAIKSFLYIGINDDGLLSCGSLHDVKLETKFSIHIISNQERRSYSGCLEEKNSRPEILLPHHCYRLIEEGYVHIENIVPKKKIFECQKYLMHMLGRPGAVTAGGAQKGFGKLGGSVSNSEPVRGLLEGDTYQPCHARYSS